MLGAHSRHDVFQAIADPTRRQMLHLLSIEDMSIAQIAESFPISRTAVNKHLHILADAGLVRSQKIGREMRYKIQPEPLTVVKEWLAYFDLYWDNKLSLLKRFVENSQEEDK